MLGDGGLGARIRDAREELGMSQAELARRIGISKNAMNDIETGDTDPRASRITAIALVLDVRTDFLLGLEVAGQRVNREMAIVDKFKAMAHIAESARITPAPPAKRHRRRKAASMG